MSEFEPPEGSGDEFDSPFAAQFRAHALANPETDLAKIVLKEEQPLVIIARQRAMTADAIGRLNAVIAWIVSPRRNLLSVAVGKLEGLTVDDRKVKEEVTNNPRRYVDNIGQEWADIRINHTKRSDNLNRLRLWMQVLDGVLVSRDNRRSLIDRMYSKAGFRGQRGNQAIRNYTVEIMTNKEGHPVRDYLASLPPVDWKLGLEAYAGLDFFLDLYSYDVSRMEDLGSLLCEANENAKTEDESGHFRTDALIDVIDQWYGLRKLREPI